MSIGQIEGAGYENKEMVVAFTATAKEGVTKFKGEPGTDKESILRDLSRVEYKRVDAAGRLLAIGPGPPPEDPLSISDWSQVEGFKIHSKENYQIPYAAFGFIAPKVPPEKESLWKKDVLLWYTGDKFSLSLVTENKTGGVSDNTYQLAAYGTKHWKVVGDVDVKIHSVIYFGQSIFNTSVGFYSNHSSEYSIDYTVAGQKRTKVLVKHLSNNSRAKRININPM